MRWVVPLAFGLAACATSQSADQKLTDVCRRNVTANERCVEVLTGSSDVRESEKEVAKAEEDRKRNAFNSRLAKLRAAEEARQAERAKTSTIASIEDWEQEDGVGWLELLSKDRGEDVGSGSSVRALQAGGPPASRPRPRPPVVEVEAPPPLSIEKPAGPDANAYLFGARCLLRADLVLLQQSLQETKKRSDREDIAGSIALVIVDAQGALSAIDQTVAKRRIGVAPLCSSSDVRPVIVLLRSLLGPRPKGTEGGDGYSRGLGRLIDELHKRAELVRPG